MTKDELRASVAALICPSCSRKELTVSWRLKAKPIGTFSLSGAQMKFSATEVPVISCVCGLESEGRVNV